MNKKLDHFLNIIWKLSNKKRYLTKIFKEKLGINI